MPSIPRKGVLEASPSTAGLAAVRRLRRTPLLGIVLLASSLLSVGIYWRYRNLIDLFFWDLRHSPAILPLAFQFSNYWNTYIDQLRLNPETGMFDFDWSIDAESGTDRLDGLEHGKLAWHRGDFATAVAHIETHHRHHGASESSLFWLAMSYLRLAEAENCLSTLTDGGHESSLIHDHASMCALPLSVHHRHQDPSRTAAELFERLLTDYDDQNRLYRWLLNFCWMTVGGFPGEVPERFLIESPFVDYFYAQGPADAARRTRHLAFRERARELGVDTLNSGKGLAVEDFDRDGYLDMVTGGHYSGLVYYRNQEGLRFEDRTEDAALTGLRGIHLITAADYDNDGWMDLFISRPNDRSRGSFLLLRNLAGDQGQVAFEDVTQSSGLLSAEAAKRTAIFNWASAWGDVDNDGDLDLFLANFSLFNPFHSGPILSSKLMLNQGGRFLDATRDFGLEPLVERQAVFGAAFGDYDADGFVDLSLTHWAAGEGFLLRNESGQGFRQTDLVMPEQNGFMTAFLDVDHDGDLDLFYGAQSGIAEAITTQVVFGERRGEYNSGRSALWLQDDGRFSADNGFFQDQMPIGTMGSNFGDLDNDGAYDFYLGTGNPEGWYILPNLMYLGEIEDGTPRAKLTNISKFFGFGTVQKGHGIVFFDFDNDGDQDLYSCLGGMWPGDPWPNQFFFNESQLEASWIKIRLRGQRSNSHGLGARIRIVAQAPSGPVVRTYHMDNKTGFGSAPYLAHIGLADATEIDRVEVIWPGETSAQTYRAEIGRLNVLEEESWVDSADASAPNLDDVQRPAVTPSRRAVSAADASR